MWEKLKKILKTSNEKAVIIEEGEPRYVILSIDEYMRLNSQTQGIEYQSTQENIAQPQYNQPSTVQQPDPLDLSSLTLTSVNQDLPAIDLADDSGSDITLEDLPL